MKKYLVAILLTFLCVITPLSVSANDTLSVKDIKNYIPSEVLKELPQDIFTNDNTESISSEFSFSYFAKLFFKFLKSSLDQSFLPLSGMIAMAVVASLLKKLSEFLKTGAAASGFDTLVSVIFCIYVFTSVYTAFGYVGDYLKNITAFTNASSPLIMIAYTLGGNVSAATVSASALSLSLTFSQNVMSTVLYPMLKLSGVFSIASCVTPRLRCSSLGAFVRGLFMFLMSLFTFSVGIIMSLQNSLAVGADTLGARAVKFAASSFIPIVGSAVGDAVRTLSASVKYIRTSVGVIGIVSVLILVLPIFIKLMLTRISLSLTSGICDMLSLEREVRVIKEGQSLINALTGASALAGVLLVYSFTLLIGCASAYGG